MIDSSILDALVEISVAQSLFSIYKHAVDLRLVHADIVFNRSAQGSAIEMEAIYNIACSMEMTEDHCTAAALFKDILMAHEFGIQIVPEITKANICRKIARASFNGGNYIEAETFAVLTLHETSLDGYTLKMVLQAPIGISHLEDVFEHHPMTVMAFLLNIYSFHQQCIMCNLRSSEMDYKVWKVYVILVLLLECAEMTSKSRWLSPEILENNPMDILRKKYKPHTAERLIQVAFMMRTVEEYHAKLLSYQSSDNDLEDMLSMIPKSDSREKQAECFEQQKAEAKIARKKFISGQETMRHCLVCRQNVLASSMKECACKTRIYCGEECQMKDWQEHKMICAYSKKRGKIKNKSS